MIAHLVLFRLRAGLSAVERADLIQAFDAGLRTIPSVRRARVGRRVLHGAGYEPAASDFPYVAELAFDDVEGLQAYLRHAAHEGPAQRFFALTEATMVFDYEMVEGEAVAAAAASWD